MENQNEILDNDYLEIAADIETQQIIGLNKFVFLSIVSFGTYDIWWMYKTWKFFKQKEKLYIVPWARAIFSIFFITSLFRKILEFAKEKGYEENYSPVSLFIGFFIVNALSRLPDPFWLISILSFIFFIQPLKALNFAKQNSSEFTVNEESSFSVRQIGLTLVGIIFWALVLFGMTVA